MGADEVELKALMVASQVGDAAAHRVLLEKLSRSLGAFYTGKLLGMGRGIGDAEDFVQEAVLAFHIKRQTYDLALTPWVHAIARYKLIDFLRRTRSSRSDVPIDEADDVIAEDDSAGAESKYDLTRLLQQLPAKTRCSIEAVSSTGGAWPKRPVVAASPCRESR
jgi:RNA polymerase sigma-70 factor, ECF subfamily